MSWTSKYWDAVEQFYWTPKYLGLKSIPRNKLVFNEEEVVVPRDLTNPNGPLYRRVGKSKDFLAFARCFEETFNHIFDLTFGILPSEVLNDLFVQICGLERQGDLSSIGREINERFGYSKTANLTAPDGYFVSDQIIVSIELKFNAKTSVDQLAKYLFLFLKEEELTGRKQDIHLTYILNPDPNEKLKTQLGFDPSNLGIQRADLLIDGVKSNGKIRSYLVQNQAPLQNLMERVRVSAISWGELKSILISYTQKIGDSKGDNTLRNLLLGLAGEIGDHPGVVEDNAEN